MSFFTALAIMGTAFSVQASAKAARAHKEATKVQIRQQQAQVSRERRGTVRRGLIARARAANVAATTGMAETSAFLGGSGAMSSQVGANLGYGGMMSGLSQDITRLSGKAAQAQGQAQMWGQVASLGMQFADFGAVGEGIKNKLPTNWGGYGSYGGGAPPMRPEKFSRG
jgi:hypothetical protein